MRLTMPNLEIGNLYCEAEVRHLFVDHGGGSTDWGRVKVRFPWRLDDPRNDDMERFRSNDEMVVQYEELPITAILEQIRHLQSVFEAKPMERQRIEAIKDKYGRNEPVYPVFLQGNDSQNRISEGMHRAVALLESGATIIPIFRTGYRDWFRS
jgi:hypothetical protein